MSDKAHFMQADCIYSSSTLTVEVLFTVRAKPCLLRLQPATTQLLLVSFYALFQEQHVVHNHFEIQ